MACLSGELSLLCSTLLQGQRKRQKGGSRSARQERSQELTNNPPLPPEEKEGEDYRGLFGSCSGWHIDRGVWDMTVSRELLHVSVRVKNKTVEVHKLPSIL